VRKDGSVLPLGGGPRLVAYRRTGRRFDDVAASSRLMQLQLAPAEPAGTLATATYEGPLRKVTWTRDGDALAMSYEIEYDGVVDIFGIGFEAPQARVLSKRWLGRGPYRVWQNRLAGGVFNVHELDYSDPIPGETYAYPEFKGYFAEWRWLTLNTAHGAVTAHNDSAIPYFGLYQPRSGEGPVLELPDVGWAMLHVIPAIGTKFDLPDALGPQSQPQRMSGAQRGRVSFTFTTQH
jgi:Beta galactosidase small chain